MPVIPETLICGVSPGLIAVDVIEPQYSMLPDVDASQIARYVIVCNDPVFVGQVIAVPFVIAAPPVLVGKFVVFAVTATLAYEVYDASVPLEPVEAAVSVVVHRAKYNVAGYENDVAL